MSGEDTWRCGGEGKGCEGREGRRLRLWEGGREGEGGGWGREREGGREGEGGGWGREREGASSRVNVHGIVTECANATSAA